MSSDTAAYFYVSGKKAKKRIIIGAVFECLLVVLKCWDPSVPLSLIGVLSLISLFFIGAGVVQLRDRSAKLIISPEKGIWTNKLGFTAWEELAKVDIAGEDGNKDSNVRHLELYLNNTGTSRDARPDDSIFIEELEGTDRVVALINTYYKGGKKNPTP